MKDNSLLRCMLSMVMCFSMLSVHARAEQSAEAEQTNTPELNNDLSVIETEASVTKTERVENIYTETSRDGELGENLTEMIPSLAKKESEDNKWIADVASRIQLHGYAQGWYYYQNAPNANGERNNTNTFLLKRVLFWANAQITPRWSFLFMHDFSSVVQEFYTDYRVTKNNALTVRLGQFKNALSYENQFSPTAMETIDVYSEGVTYLTGCGSDPLNGVQYGRDQGISLFGETNNKSFRYELQVMNGSGINMKDKNNQKDVIARLEVRPVKGLNICATGQLGTGYALVSNPVFNPELQAGENYKRNRWTIGADYKSRPFNIHGEYLAGKDGDVCSKGAYVTGNMRLFTLPKNRSIDAVWSYDYFNFNTTQKMDMHKVVAGLQYWFFKKCRFQAQYVYKNANTDYRSFFERGANHQFICQMQVRFN